MRLVNADVLATKLRHMGYMDENEEVQEVIDRFARERDGDLISRQAAIDAALEDVSDKRTHEFNAGVIRAVSRIKSLPSAQPEQRWIPVSERLPEVDQCVLCYLKGWRYMGKYRVCKYRDADKYVNHPYFDFNENGLPEVLAWMPLPEPYRGGEK